MSRPGRPTEDDLDGDRPTEADDATPGRSAWSWSVPIAVIVAVGAIYLGPWLRDPNRLPVGFDTAGYVWRANALWEDGLDALPTFRERPGHPVIVGVLRDVTRGTPIDLARTWPATIAVAIGAAVAALAWAAGAGPAVVALATAIAVAGSGFVAATAVGYAANLLVDVFLVAGVTVALRMRRTGIPAVLLSLLVAAAFVTHWMFALLLVGLVAVVALTFLADRRGDGPPATRSAGRLAAALAIAILLGGAALLLAPELPSHGVQQTFNEGVERRVARRMPPFRLETTLPLAAAGALAIGVLGDRTRRRGLPALLVWAAVAPAGLLAWYALDVNVPPYRSAGVALGVPLLIVLGPGAAIAWARARHRWLPAVVATAAAAAAAVWLSVIGATTWWRTEPIVSRDDLAQAVALDAYVATLPAGTTVVVPVGGDRDPPQLILKLGMRASAVEAVELRPADLSDGTGPFVDETTRADPDAVIVLLAAYHRHQPERGFELTPGVVVMHGPTPDAALRVGTSDSSAGALIRIALISIGLLLVVGAGWTLAFGRTGAVVAVCLAPGAGAAVLVVVGLVAARIGIGFPRGGGIAVAVVAGAMGWIAWAVDRFRRRSAGGP